MSRDMLKKRIGLEWRGLRSGAIFIVMSLLLIASDAFVFLGEASAAGGPGHVPSIADTFKHWGNFLAFFAILIFLVRKPFLAFWSQRAEDVYAAVNAGKEAEKAALSRLEEAQARYAKIDDEVKALKARIAEEAQAESKRIVEEAKLRSSAIAARAEEGITAEQGNLETRLREELAEHVVSRAQEIVQSKLNDQVDRGLRQRTVQGVKTLLH